MRWTASKGDLAGQTGDLIIRPVLRGDQGADLGGLQSHDGLGDLIARAGFTGAAGTSLPVHCPGMKASISAKAATLKCLPVPLPI